MTRCDHCGAETSNGLNLCETCRLRATTCLEFLPIYYRNLARQRRPGRPNGSLGGSGQWMLRHGDTDSTHVGQALTRAATDLTTWADRIQVTPAGDTEPDTFADLCNLLDGNLARIATLDHAGRFIRDLTKHEVALRGLTETIVPGWYAGTCQQPAGRDLEGVEHICGANTYVVPGLTWVTCPRCGTTTHASDHVAVVLHEAADWTAPPMRIAEALVVLLESEHSIPRLYERIKKWGIRGRIPSIRTLDEDGDPTGPRRHRLGDVHARLQADGPSVDVQLLYRRLVERITGETHAQRAYRLLKARITGETAALTSTTRTNQQPICTVVPYPVPVGRGGSVP